MDMLALRYAHDSLRSNNDFVMKILEVHKSPNEILPWASEAVRSSHEVMQAAVCIDGASLQHAAGSLQADESLALSAIKHSTRSFEWVSTDLQSSSAFLARAIHLDWKIACYASLAVLQDEAVLQHLCAQLGNLCSHAQRLKDNLDSEGSSEWGASTPEADKQDALQVAVAEADDLFQII